MGQINVDGGHGGDAPQEHPQRQRISRERGKEEDRVDGGEEEERGRGGAEGQIRAGGVIRWESVRCILHLICRNTPVMGQQTEKLHSNTETCQVSVPHFLS